MDTDTLITRYLSGDSTIKLAVEAKVSVQTVINRLRKRGVEIRTRGGRLTTQQGLDIAAEYETGTSSLSLGQHHGLSHSAVIGLARRHGKKVRSRHDYVAPRKHVFREDFFAQWTPDMAYVLGLVATDGSVDGKSLRLYQKEVDLLDQVSLALESTKPYIRCGLDLPTLRLNSVRLIRDLRALGIHPNKVRTIRAPNVVPYPQDYLRGIFDGDGHGGYYKKRDRRCLRIGFTSSSRGFLEDIQALAPMPIGGPYLNRGCWSLQTSREADALSLRDWMYDGSSNIHSRRKRAKLFVEK
jgi:hypothetical protein